MSRSVNAFMRFFTFTLSHIHTFTKMNFRTQLQPTPSFSISHEKNILCMGSCFAEHMALKLQERKFPVLLNPFGIIYNPLSLAGNLIRLLQKNKFSGKEMVEDQGRWHSLAHHGSFSGRKRDGVVRKVNTAFRKGQEFLEKTDVLILTLGTAFVYEYLPTGEIVANCHKIPAKKFEKRLLRKEMVVQALHTAIISLLERQPDCKIILTVSPVRHLRDGMVENQQSKATLLLSVGELADSLPQIDYFPSYELLMDDLRDYRFYGDDLVHPSPMAIDYIWDFFAETYFRKNTREMIRKVEKVRAAALHRPFDPKSPQHRSFTEKQLDKISQLEKKYSFLDFKEEKKKLNPN
jgi:hypothetical protein